MRHLVGLSLGLALGFAPLALANPSDPFSRALPSRDTKAPEGVEVGGDGGVSAQQGAATYSYPLELPPPRHGMAPHLSFDYSSSAPLRGDLAAGWTLGGLPTIERDPASDSSGNVAYRYGGELLVRTPGDLGTGTRYRPVFDEGMTRLGLSAGTWTVSTPDGVIQTFANLPYASDGVANWQLTSERDAFGNTVNYTWVRTLYGAGAAYSLVTIEYSSNPSASLTAHARVELAYENPEYCASGALPIGSQLDHHTGRAVVRGSQRLKLVTVKVRDVAGGNWRRTREYQPRYDLAELACTNDRPPLRYLRQLVTTGYDALGAATTAPAVTFGYGPTQRDLSHTFSPGTIMSPWLGGLGERGTDRGPEAQLMDLDGDGINDQVRAAMPAPGASRCRLVVRRGVFGGGFAVREDVMELPSAPWSHPAAVVGEPRPGPAEGDSCTLDGQVASWGGGHDNAPTPACWFDKIEVNYRFVDWDHDGDLDLVTWIWQGGFARGERDFEPIVGWFQDEETDPAPGPCNGSNAPGCTCPTGTTQESDGSCRVECSAGQAYDPASGQCVYACSDYESCHDWPGGGGGGPPGGDPGTGPHCTMNLPEPEDRDVIRVYYNHGAGFSDFVGAMAPDVVIADPPRPLPPTGKLLTAPANGSMSLSNLVDIDGDGRLDMIELPPSEGNVGSATAFRVWRGTAAGSFEPDFTLWPKATWTQSVGTVSPAGAAPVLVNAALTWLDVDGDGLLDILTTTPNGSGSELAVSYNQAGSFSALRLLGVGAMVGQSRIELQGAWNGVPALQPGWHADTIQMIDLDDDGLAELAMTTVPAGGSVSQLGSGRYAGRLNGDFFVGWTSRGALWESVERLMHATNQRAWYRASDYLDLTGDGQPDLVELDSDGRATVHTDAAGAAPIRLLASIDNGRGAVTRYTYARSTDPTVVTASAGMRNDPRWVVRSVVTTPGALQPDLRTTYRYGAPVFGVESPLDGHAPQFRGYATVTIDRSGQAGDASSRTVDTFTYDVAPRDGRGHLASEWTYVAVGGGWSPMKVETSTWTSATLVGGQASFTYRNGLVTQICDAGATEAQCAIENEQRRTQRETWVAWTGAGTEPLLYEHTESSDERKLNNGWGGVERRISVRVYQERVGQAPYAATDYRLLLTERETRSYGPTVTLTRESTTYDPRGLPTHSYAHTGASTYAHTQRTFDAAGNVLTIKRPVQFANGTNNLATIAYDAFGLYPATTTNELGHVVFEKHDVATGVTTRREGPNKRTPTRCVLPPCIVYAPEEWKLDGFGRVVEHRVATDAATGNGYVLTPVEWFGYVDGAATTRRTERARDLDGVVRLTTVDALDGLGRVVRRTEVSPAGASTQYSYDAGGALRTIDAPSPASNAARAITRYDRDGLGRVTRFTRPDGTMQLVGYLGADVESQESSPIDGLGPLTRFEHDGFGRLAAVHEPDASGDHVTRYAYDVADRMTSIVDADGATTSIVYDWAGRRSQMTRGTRTWTYGYDMNGNLTSQRSPVPAGGDPAKYVSTTTYDDLDRARIHTPAPRTLTPAQRTLLGIGPITTTYDGGANATGAPSRVTLPFGTFDYTYDVRGRLKREQRVVSTAASGVAVTATQYVDRTYDALGAPLDVTWDDGTSWRTAYDSRGLVASVSWADPAAGYKNLATYTRGVLGQPLSRTNVYNQRRDWTYDVLGRVTHDRTWKTSAPVATFAERNYGYDGFGRLGAVQGTVASVTADADFEYDGRGRLAHAAGPGAYNASLTYSPSGNVAHATVSGAVDAPTRDVSYQYGAIDPHAVDRLVAPDGTPFAQLAYDAAGNLTQRTIGASTWQLTSDGDDLIRQVSGPEGTETYYFGPGGERIAAIGGSGVKLWFAESETHYAAGGAQTVRWHHIASGEPLARVEDHTAIELQYADALQNLMVTLSPSSAVTSSFLYGGFGEVVASTGAATHRREFNGKESDVVSGLRAYGYRSYDPVLLRWTAADPKYRFAPDAAWTEPQRGNLYAFSLNNPLTYYDPDGREPEKQDEADWELVLTDHHDPYPATRFMISFITPQKGDSVPMLMVRFNWLVQAPIIIAPLVLGEHAVKEIDEYLVTPVVRTTQTVFHDIAVAGIEVMNHPIFQAVPVVPTDSSAPKPSSRVEPDAQDPYDQIAATMKHISEAQGPLVPKASSPKSRSRHRRRPQPAPEPVRPRPQRGCVEVPEVL